MRIDILEAYNLDRDILDIWRRTVGPELLPVQERAVKEFGLFGRDNLIVFSPTSSGKTFVGEMAAVKAAREKTKVFYLVPQKALAEEKFRDFSARYAEAQIRVVISSATTGSTTRASSAVTSRLPWSCSRSSRACSSATRASPRPWA